ncbi:MAG: DUF1634 domain-containing protein [Nitrososphaerota archaeon]|nr:DUF1634 domain-containing protein [Candidatus Bathyarchaeota archaeon]MDW8061941.1 DUF1634 domain-containing protein [Nitrososphaerota archaeon]
MKLEPLISYILRIGVIVGITLAILGMLLLLVKGGSLGYTLDMLLDPYTFINTCTVNYSLVYRGLASFEGLSIILLGLIVMVATPILRIILGILIFALEKDRVYVAIATATLTLILLSIFLVSGIL